MSSSPIFVKLGGSLITDKSQAYTVRQERLTRLAQEVRQALDAAPQLSLLMGHGSGSFGHWAAEPYGTREGVETPDEWRGYAIVATAAQRLNRIVTDALTEAGVPVISIQPSASARCRDGVVQHLALPPIQAALRNNLVPLIYGDVALDEVRGGTIASTEDLFVYLAELLAASHILLFGEVDGVLDAQNQVIPTITPADIPRLQDVLGSSEGVDVTGGMIDKVTRMTNLVQRQPSTRVRILSGTEPGSLKRALLNPDLSVGTSIEA